MTRFSKRAIFSCLVAKRITDKRVLKLIRAFLNAGVMEKVPASAIDEGTPQGGPLSPLLINIVLDELERRGHRLFRIHRNDWFPGC
jgi:RNA-directed DNA polymerase